MGRKSGVDIARRLKRSSRPYSFADVVERFGGSIELAQALRVPRGSVRAWKCRDSIPPAYWGEIARAAEDRDIKGITVKRMAKLKARV